MPMKELLATIAYFILSLAGAAARVDAFAQFVGVDVGDGPEGHAGVSPGGEVVALPRVRRLGCSVAGRRGPGVEVDEVLSALVDERGDGASVEVVEAAPGEREAFRGGGCGG